MAGASVVAGMLWVVVAVLVVTQGGELARSRRAQRQQSERDLVTDCLANLDQLTHRPHVTASGADLIIDLRERDRDRAGVEYGIDMRDVQPRNAPVAHA